MSQWAWLRVGESAERNGDETTSESAEGQRGLDRAWKCPVIDRIGSHGETKLPAVQALPSEESTGSRKTV
jgi:hypothetical protein